jgi:hypothetical protein
MTMTKRTPWLRIGFGAWSLGLEASSVIGLRALKISAGGLGAATETMRMISEKVRPHGLFRPSRFPEGLD